MTRLQQLPDALQRSLEQRSTLKVIAGLMNFDAASVERVARAAGHGGADLIDVACDAELVRLAIEASGGVPVCVSSVEPEQFPAAVAAGAVMVEIGNFDAFYPQGRIFGAEEVLELTRRTRELLPEVVLSVTVPEAQRPVVQPLQVLQQHQQGHRVLAAGHRQQQRSSLGQQLRLLQQPPVQTVVPGSPAQGGMGAVPPRCENQGIAVQSP